MNQPLQIADPAAALEQLPPVPVAEVAATPETVITQPVAFFRVEPQVGWNNTQIEVNISPLSLFIGIVLGFFLAVITGRV